MCQSQCRHKRKQEGGQSIGQKNSATYLTWSYNSYFHELPHPKRPILLLIFPILLLFGGSRAPPGPFLYCAYGAEEPWKLKLERSKLILGSVDKGISSTKISLIVLMRVVNREQKILEEFSVLARIFQNEKLQNMSFLIISFKSINSNRKLVE